MDVYILFFTILTSILPGQPAANTKVVLKQDDNLIAYQVSGETGKISFKNLNKGSYKLLFVFPQQVGKYIEQEIKFQTETDAAYNPVNKTYYYRSEKGYFIISYSTKKIPKQGFTALFKEEQEKGENYHVTAEFGVKNKGGAINIAIKAITASQYKAATDNLKRKLLLRSGKIFKEE